MSRECNSASLFPPPELCVGLHPARQGKWARLVLQDAKELDWDGIDALDAAAAVRNDFRDKTAPPIEDGEGA